MNFTCGGTIRRLTFLGWLSESTERFDITRLTSWPHFSLWHPRHHPYFEEMQQIGPSYYDLQTDSLRLNANHQLVEVTFNLTMNITFSADDILGVTLTQRNGSTVGSGINMTVVKESRGYGKTLVCYPNSRSTHACFEDSFRERPYIAIETGEIESMSGIYGIITIPPVARGTIIIIVASNNKLMIMHRSFKLFLCV
jgi:hypothetical protein